jgi:hypothetical protein
MVDVAVKHILNVSIILNTTTRDSIVAGKTSNHMIFGHHGTTVLISINLL